MTAPIARPLTWRRPACDGRGDRSTCAPTLAARARSWPTRPSAATSPARSDRSRRRRPAINVQRLRWSATRAATTAAHRLRSACRVRRLVADIHLASQPAASRNGTTRCRPSCRRRAAAGHGAAPAPLSGAFGLGACLAEGHDAGLPRRRPNAASPRRPSTLPPSRTKPVATPSPLWQVAKAKGKAFVDFQHDVTADDVRLAASRRLRLGRAPQALHHARHGDRPGQDLQLPRPRHHGRCTGQADRRGRHDALPPALHAGRRSARLRRASSRPGFQARAADADA